MELKFNCFFLMPVIDSFPTRLREELEAAYEEDLDEVSGWGAGEPGDVGGLGSDGPVESGWHGPNEDMADPGESGIRWQGVHRKLTSLMNSGPRRLLNLVAWVAGLDSCLLPAM